MEATLVQSSYETERGKPMPSKNHAIVQQRLTVQLVNKYGKEYEILPEISLGTTAKERVPDIGIYPVLAFIPGEDEVKMEIAPLGVIEILSPSQSLTELITKSVDYFRAGVKSYWLVLTDLRTIYVFSAPNEYEVFTKKEKLTDAQLDIEISLADIFR
jgi:Uma2 family endonuclease